jgi:drug/metabolite transporter (DMT)-like permease
VFVFRVIAQFGVVTLTIVTTAKKFCGVVLSAAIFHHQFSMLQWQCIALVLVGSTLDFWRALYKPKPSVYVLHRIKV